MFNLIGGLLKTAVAVVTTPVAVVADVVTYGQGSKSGSHTADAVENIVKNLEKTVDPDRKP